MEGEAPCKHETLNWCCLNIQDSTDIGSTSRVCCGGGGGGGVDSSPPFSGTRKIYIFSCNLKLAIALASTALNEW